MVMLSQYAIDDPDKRFLTTTDIPIFFIASLEDRTPNSAAWEISGPAHGCPRTTQRNSFSTTDAAPRLQMLEKKKNWKA